MVTEIRGKQQHAQTLPFMVENVQLKRKRFWLFTKYSHQQEQNQPSYWYYAMSLSSSHEPSSLIQCSHYRTCDNKTASHYTTCDKTIIKKKAFKYSAANLMHGWTLNASGYCLKWYMQHYNLALKNWRFFLPFSNLEPTCVFFYNFPLIVCTE